MNPAPITNAISPSLQNCHHHHPKPQPQSKQPHHTPPPLPTPLPHAPAPFKAHTGPRAHIRRTSQGHQRHNTAPSPKMLHPPDYEHYIHPTPANPNCTPSTPTHCLIWSASIRPTTLTTCSKSPINRHDPNLNKSPPHPTRHDTTAQICETLQILLPSFTISATTPDGPESPYPNAKPVKLLLMYSKIRNVVKKRFPDSETGRHDEEYEGREGVCHVTNLQLKRSWPSNGRRHLSRVHCARRGKPKRLCENFSISADIIQKNRLIGYLNCLDLTMSDSLSDVEIISCYIVHNSSSIYLCGSVEWVCKWNRNVQVSLLL